MIASLNLLVLHNSVENIFSTLPSNHEIILKRPQMNEEFFYPNDFDWSWLDDCNVKGKRV